MGSCGYEREIVYTCAIVGQFHWQFSRLFQALTRPMHACMHPAFHLATRAMVPTCCCKGALRLMPMDCHINLRLSSLSSRRSPSGKHPHTSADCTCSHRAWSPCRGTMQGRKKKAQTIQYVGPGCRHQRLFLCHGLTDTNSCQAKRELDLTSLLQLP